MARAHATIPQAAEIMFCDCTSSLDRFNTSLFILSTCHPAGGIPLGILMTSDEKEETIQAALQMLEDVLPQNAFYGNGVQKGPAVVMTGPENNVAIINSATMHLSLPPKEVDLAMGRKKQDLQR